MAGAASGAQGTWNSRWTFILAATGSAVGLGNMWKFPYVAGTNGGGAFVLVYVACVLAIGVPVMMAESMIGRRARQNPTTAMGTLIQQSSASTAWRHIGWMGVLAGVLILSFYGVIAGWALDYVLMMADGEMAGATGATALATFNELLSNPSKLILWQTLFMALCVATVVGGVQKGLGRAIEIMMPLLFILMLCLLVFAMIYGDFAKGFSFMFSVDFSALTRSSVLEALGQAFFTLSIGMGAIMAYGAYMPQDASIGRTILTVGFFDTMVAIISGLVIFPIVFATPGLTPGDGPGLMFISLPVAFGSITGGLLIGTVFFVLVTIAAWSSAISLIEPAVAWLIESKGMSRLTANLAVGVFAWLVGLGTVFSFNIWSDIKPAGMTFFDWLDFITSNIMLPLTGLLIALFVGFAMKRSEVEDEMKLSSGVMKLWILALRYWAPIAIALVMISGIYNKFSG